MVEIVLSVFCKWNARTWEKKDPCEGDKLILEEFQTWLKQS